MKRVPKQTVLGFGRKDRAINRQIRQRSLGQKVKPGLGRPPKNNGRVKHGRRPVLAEHTALHVTVRLKRGMPNLRKRSRFNVVKRAFVKFCKLDGFRLVHFAVMSNHCHFIVEADSRPALARGMQKLLHSISRRLNALSVKEKGGRVDREGGKYSMLEGWLGRIFDDRFFAKQLGNPTQMSTALNYVASNAEHHYGMKVVTDPCTSLAAIDDDEPSTASAKGYLLKRACIRLLGSLAAPSSA